jgi:hypothetical protein
MRRLLVDSHCDLLLCWFRWRCWPAAARADLMAWCIRSRAGITCGRRAFPFSASSAWSRARPRTKAWANLHVAEIESFSEKVDGEELNRMVEEKLGSGWERIIRETSRAGQRADADLHSSRGRPDGDVCGGSRRRTRWMWCRYRSIPSTWTTTSATIGTIASERTTLTGRNGGRAGLGVFLSLFPSASQVGCEGGRKLGPGIKLSICGARLAGYTS